MLIKLSICALGSLLKERAELVAENSLLRYQLAVLHRGRRRVLLRRWDRPILAWISKCVRNWKDVLIIVQPETLIRWHRKGFSLFWGSKFSSKAGGRRSLDPKTIGLIREISQANPLWGSPRIHGELLKLGIQVSQATVDKYRVRRSRPGNQNWKAFLDNHLHQTVAIDFFVVPTIRFRMLWALVVLSHDRRKILHMAVTHQPSQPWTMQQLRNTFPFESLPKYLLHDRDRAFWGLSRLGVEEIITGYRCPWQNGYVERVIGSIRRECTDHLIVVGERHLTRILKSYQEYYNDSRTHLALNKDSPNSRPTKRHGRTCAAPRVGGLHHEFTRIAA